MYHFHNNSYYKLYRVVLKYEVVFVVEQEKIIACWQFSNSNPARLRRFSKVLL